MSLSDLGNLGEFVSGLAVVISPLYLAVQIRQNTRSLRAGAHQSITSHIAELNRTIVENAEVARLLEMGLRSMLRFHLTQPGIVRWWEEARAFYSPDFVAYVAALQDELRSSRDASHGKGALVGDGSDLW